jgi:hypothetical protein
MSNIDETLDPKRLKSRWGAPTPEDARPASAAFAEVSAAKDPGATARVILNAIRQRVSLEMPEHEAELDGLIARVEAIVNEVAGGPRLDDEGRPVDLFTHAPGCEHEREPVVLPTHPTSEKDAALVGELLVAIADLEDVASVLLRHGFAR